MNIKVKLRKPRRASKTQIAEHIVADNLRRTLMASYAWQFNGTSMEVAWINPEVRDVSPDQ